MTESRYSRGFVNSLIWVIYLVTSIGMFLYSYTQVDLNLTLSRAGIFQTIQKAFQYLGYYQRPLSTAIFISLVLTLFILYGFVLYFIRKGVISDRSLWRIVLPVSIISVFSYPAFSYDFFNYMFSAKTVLVYHQNPYTVTPLAFTGVEPWLTFLRWTHLPSAYTPIWILMSLVPYIFGFGYFLLIMWNMKLLLAVFYLLTVWSIGKILSVTDKPNVTFGMAVFALNPLVLTEAIISPHNDIVMMGLAVTAYYLYLTRHRWSSILILASSVAVKLMTVFLFPLVLFGWNRKAAFWLMAAALVAGFIHKELLPWYFLWVMPFVALYPVSLDLVIIASGVSLGLLLRYAPILFFGDYGQSALVWRDRLTVVSVILVLLWVGLRHLKTRVSDI